MVTKEVKSISTSRILPSESNAMTREAVPSTPKQGKPDTKGNKSNWMSPNTWMSHGQVRSESRCCVDCGAQVD
jgi:hypothetical protein